MTAPATLAAPERTDVRTIVGGGIKLGVLTAVGVAVFALASRAMTGTVETIVQSALIFAGGVVFAFLPSVWTRPRTTDGIAWTALVGLLGALAFTVADVVVLRPLSLYHWTWDEIGGGSGVWYIPVWWMGAAFLAWLGGMVVGYASRGAREANPLAAGVITAGIGVVLFALIAAVGLLPFHPAAAALGFTLAVVVHVPLAAVMHRR